MEFAHMVQLDFGSSNNKFGNIELQFELFILNIYYFFADNMPQQYRVSSVSVTILIPCQWRSSTI